MRRRTAFSARAAGAAPQESGLCACHARWIPLVSRWRIRCRWGTGARPMRTPHRRSGILVDGTRFDGPAEMRHALMARRDQIVAHGDGKAADIWARRGSNTTTLRWWRQLARDAAAHNHSWSSVILGIVQSTPFKAEI